MSISNAFVYLNNKQEQQAKKLVVAVMGENPHEACVGGGGALNSSWFPSNITNVPQYGRLPHGSQFNLLTKGQRDALLFTMEQLSSSLVSAEPRDLSTKSDNILPYSRGRFLNSPVFMVNSLDEVIEAEDVEAAEDFLAIHESCFMCHGCGTTKRTSYGTLHNESSNKHCGYFNLIQVNESGGTTKWIKWTVRGYCPFCPVTGRLNSNSHYCKGRGGLTSTCTSLVARPEDVDREEPPKYTAKLWIKTVDGKVYETFDSTIQMEKDFSERYEEKKSQNPAFGTNDSQIQSIVRNSSSQRRRDAINNISGPLQNGIVGLGNIKYHGVPILYNGKNPSVVAVTEKLPATVKNTAIVTKKTTQPSILKTLKLMPPAVAKKPATDSTTSATKSEKPTQRCTCLKGDCTTMKCACRKAGKPCGAHCDCDCKKCNNGNGRKKSIKSFFSKLEKKS